ncbi:uncharacterized protein B0P05DRAFT_558210 [Gilbertella persicaria]|uniref:uncharacterized protein n=1 Tax=Gilbertella persicaria TaxID=101096 RepID=UPI002220CE35|nr:uncharacterized protein B0P05DRAFT_558210 [Gilbertella persicaria]KAI8059956.1 hypothetical protein B0P05DRAFT_558210 [Gilbertella persicaria]
MGHDHHDHSNCNHDHGSHGSPKGLKKANDEINLRQQAAEKLAKSLVELQTMSNEFKKQYQLKTSNEPISKADVDMLMNEMQLAKTEAEQVLRNNKGDVVSALTYLVAQ